MFVAHVGAHSGEENVGNWLKSIADGRSSILFATLAGVSLAILSGRNNAYTGVALLQAKVRIFTRAALLLVISGLLAMVNMNIALILAFYAAWFVAAIPFLKLRARTLFILAGATAIIGPFIAKYGVALLGNLGMFPGVDASNFVNEVFLTGTYVGLVYMAFVFAGLGIGRLDLSSKTVASYLASIGASLAIVGYGSAFLIGKIRGQELDPYGMYGYDDYFYYSEDKGPGFGWPDDPFWPDIAELLTADPHSGTPFEAIGSGGFAISLIGFLLLAGPIIGKILYPIAAVGSMSLTAYSAHVIAVFAIPSLQLPIEDWPLLWLTLTVMAVCTLWRLFFNRGPLEKVMTWASKRAARVEGPPQVLGQVPPQAPPGPARIDMPNVSLAEGRPAPGAPVTAPPVGSDYREPTTLVSPANPDEQKLHPQDA